MIVVRLYGGLGNQLFQYATARRLAYINDTELALDTSDLSRNVTNITKRNYELWRYPIRARLLSAHELKLSKLYNNRILNRIPLPRPWKLHREKFFQFDPTILRLKDEVYLDGYWQCPKYFDDIEDLLKFELTPKHPMGSIDKAIFDSIRGSNSVSVHVRRGDYVSIPRIAQTHGICSLDYYRKAIQLMMSRLDNPSFFIFSDDSDWTRKNILINAHTEYVAHNNADSAFQDLRLMTLCQHQIIANSSFSWWGAWLNYNHNKIVVAPKLWFLDSRDASCIVPQSWIRI